MIIKISCLSIILFLSSFSNDKNPSYKIDFKIKDHETYYSKEKIYLHLDKPYYSSGDDIWFKVYLVNAQTLQQDSPSKLVYVDLINSDQEIIKSRIIKIDNGGGQGDFKLDTRLKSGEYLIRAYTNYMRNFDHAYFFRQKIQIMSIIQEESSQENIATLEANNEVLNKSLDIEKPDVQFLPEGGNMVNGLPNRIGFKALGANGKGIDVQGVIIDNIGNKITSFKTSKFGLGRLLLIPEKGKSYTAHISFNDQNFLYDLPMALDRGIVMQVHELRDNFRIGFQSSIIENIDNLVLVGQQNEEVVCEAKIKGLENNTIVNIPKSILKEGLVQFTLIDENLNPLCERLVFVENENKELEMNISPSRNSYKPRELVEVDLSIKSMEQNNIQAVLSIAITDISVVNKNPFGLHIRSYLLLNSDMRGAIENPGYYFDKKNPQRKRDLDILLMTQGWRRFLIKDIAKESLIKYKYETGISFSGRLKNGKNDKKLSITELTLFYNDRDQSFYDKVNSDALGNFKFGDYDIKDSASIIIQSNAFSPKKRRTQKTGRTKKMHYTIHLDSFVLPKVTFESNSTIESYQFNINDYVERSKTLSYEDSVWAYKGEIVHLNEVELETVYSKKKEAHDQKLRRSTSLYREPSNRLDFSELGYEPYGNVLLALQNRIPGLIINKNNNELNINIRGQSSLFGSNLPLILLNNVPLEYTMYDFSVLEAISAQDVHFVDILKGSAAAIYGSRASKGIIAIYTKDGTESNNEIIKRESKGILNFIHPGYYKTREFYEPIYKIEKPEHKKPDLRSTISWKPNIKLDENGKAKISFYAADIPTTYRVDLQGITDDGVPFVSEAFINID